MTKKRMIALGLSTALALSMSAPAFASKVDVAAGGTPVDGSAGYSADLTISGGIQVPTIKVTVPANGSVIINPYKMEYTWSDGFSNTVETGTASTSIISPTQFVLNESNVDIGVGVEVTGTPTSGGKATLATAKPTDKTTTKSVYMYFEAVEASDNSAAPTWADVYDKAKHVLVGTTAVKKDSIVTLEAGTEADGTTAVTGAKKYGAFHFAGDVAGKTEEPWTSDDKVDVKVAFTFTPLTNTQ